MTQNRSQPSGQPAPRPKPQAQGAARPQPAGSAPKRPQGTGSDFLTRWKNKIREFIRNVPADAWKIAVVGLVCVVLAGFAQAAWPDGFPLRTKQAETAAVSPVYAAGAVRLNEIMTSNSKTLRTSDGLTADWVEIINTGSSPVNIRGYSLAKTSNAPALTFPDCPLQPGECALVYCDGLSRQTVSTDLHAPFRLSYGGDSLMLFNASGTAIDTVNIPALTTDESYIRTGTTTWQATRAATPGMENTQANYEARYSATAEDAMEITELMATNKSYEPDTFGEFSDYIEVHNTSDQEINLKGYYLSDDAADPMKWCFPDVTLAAGHYLLVYCSGRGAVQDGELHTSFRLRSEGEQAVLSNPKGQIIQVVTYGILKADQAYSRLPDGSFSVALSPTPGKPNGQ